MAFLPSKGLIVSTGENDNRIVLHSYTEGPPREGEDELVEMVRERGPYQDKKEAALKKKEA